MRSISRLSDRNHRVVRCKGNGGGFVPVGLHRLLATIAFRSDRLGGLFKGQPEILVQDGRPDLSAMRKHSISEKDLMEEARLNGQVTDMAQIQKATIERNGHISVIPVGISK